ncbi:hypothetical protein O1L68_34720 [Streptomyces lydicus]|nr:hypothetical protein [Streptomyces lydicus]
MVLAALIHVLGCAHGPAPAGTGRADTFLAVSSACSQVTETTEGTPAESPGHGGHGSAECSGADEPSVQAPRSIGAPEQSAVAPRPGDVAMVTGASAAVRPHVGNDSAGAAHGHTRALLGVWQN